MAGKTETCPLGSLPQTQNIETPLQLLPPQGKLGVGGFVPLSLPNKRRGSMTSDCVLVQTFAFVLGGPQTGSFLVSAYNQARQKRVPQEATLKSQNLDVQSSVLFPSFEGKAKSWIFPPDCTALHSGRNYGE